MFRKMEKDLIILEILSCLVEVMINTLQTEDMVAFCKEYETKVKGICGFVRRFFKRISEEEKEKYDCYKSFIAILTDLKIYIEKLKEMPVEQKEKVALKRGRSQKKEQKLKMFISGKTGLEISDSFAVKYKDLKMMAENDIAIYAKSEDEYIEEYNEYKEASQVQEQEIWIKRIDKVNNLKKIITSLLEDYKEESKRGIMIYLDDFYQIAKVDHPYIIQYLHDIYKVTKSNTFCFKVVTLPASLKINYDNEVIFSIKDDFSSVYLDYDLSNLDKVQEHLIEILIALEPNIKITKSDINSLFTNDDAFKFLVIATGGIPRDFMTSFCEAVRISKRDRKSRIGKDQIYEVIKNLKTDKENNIEIDSELQADRIECAIEAINTEIIGSMKTNVILYPADKAEQHEKLLRNLTNLRYFHLIKQKTTSEKTKQECRAYLVDMTFYACSRMSSSFDFCRFWEMDSASRLNNLRRAPIWSFSEERVKEILK